MYILYTHLLISRELKRTIPTGNSTYPDSDTGKRDQVILKRSSCSLVEVNAFPLLPSYLINIILYQSLLLT